jgi:ribosomal protein S18 acetylase RimI-like enzyme
MSSINFYNTILLNIKINLFFSNLKYSYELQLEALERGKGLGSFMMQCLEAIAISNKMQKVVLTVLKHNPMALSFFYRLE